MDAFKSVSALSLIPLCRILSARALGVQMGSEPGLNVDFWFRRLKSFMTKVYFRKWILPCNVLTVYFGKPA